MEEKLIDAFEEGDIFVLFVDKQKLLSLVEKAMNCNYFVEELSTILKKNGRVKDHGLCSRTIVRVASDVIPDDEGVYFTPEVLLDTVSKIVSLAQKPGFEQDAERDFLKSLKAMLKNQAKEKFRGAFELIGLTNAAMSFVEHLSLLPSDESIEKEDGGRIFLGRWEMHPHFVNTQSHKQCIREVYQVAVDYGGGIQGVFTCLEFDWGVPIGCNDNSENMSKCFEWVADPTLCIGNGLIYNRANGTYWS